MGTVVESIAELRLDDRYRLYAKHQYANSHLVNYATGDGLTIIQTSIVDRQRQSSWATSCRSVCSRGPSNLANQGSGLFGEHQLSVSVSQHKEGEG